MWGGRFSGDPDALAIEFVASIHLDVRLYQFDIQGSIAHARMLAEVGIITKDECRQIIETLEDIGKDIGNQQCKLTPDVEDIHSVVESELIKRLGDVGRKLHTGRSRNDQVSTDMRLYIRRVIDDLIRELVLMQRALIDLAERNETVIVPGYTHLQRAQPVLVAHYLLAYVEKFERDKERLLDCRKRTNTMSLGTAALAGSSLPIDRRMVAADLGFERIAMNSLDASHDRDFVVEMAFCLATIAVHLSGWSEEWVIWITTEFSFLRLPDAYCTGSSIMPQKKNPDALELIRGRSGRVCGNLSGILTMLKGLPLAYNRDLQEDKQAIFDSIDTVFQCLQMACRIVASASFNSERISSSLEAGFLDATTVMEGFVESGMPMRTAHEMVGKLVKRCEELGCTLDKLPSEAIDEIAPGMAYIVSRRSGVRQSIDSFISEGSTGPKQVKSQIKYWRKVLADVAPK
jgi:argininosuccinate lyase